MKTSFTTYQTYNGYELSDHLSNVRVVLTDKRVSTYNSGFLTSVSTDISSWSDYFSFGWEIPGRHVDLPNSRYTFNGKELDREWDKLDFGARPYDRKRGQWITMDPIDRSDESMYAGFSNNPIIKIDPRGDDDYFSENGKFLGTDYGKSKNIVIVDEDIFRMAKKTFLTSVHNNNIDFDDASESMNRELSNKGTELKDAIFAKSYFSRNVLKGIVKYYSGWFTKNWQTQPNISTGIGAWLATTSYELDKKLYIKFYISNFTGKMYGRDQFNNYDNLINAIVHEHAHFLYTKKTEATYGLEFASKSKEYHAGGPQTPKWELELNAYYYSSSHASYAATTSAYKNDNNRYIGMYLLNIDDKTVRREYELKFEKLLNIDFDLENSKLDPGGNPERDIILFTPKK